MLKSYLESKAPTRAATLICGLALAAAFQSPSSSFISPAQAGDPAKAAIENGLTIMKKWPAPGNQSALQMSLEQAMWTALAFEDANKLHDLIKRGADPNRPEQLSQMTPIMAAETKAMAKILLQAGADPNLRDRTGRTALHHAVKMRDAGSIVRLLGEAGADVNARAGDMSDSTPLISAVEHYLEDKNRNETAVAIRILVHLGADVDVADAGGRTPLALAATNNQADLIKLLIDLGADPDRKMINGRTPLDYAREANAEEAIQALAAAPSKQPPAN